MIALSFTTKALLVEAPDKLGEEILSSPLHRLFLRGQMDAKFNENSATWEILWEHSKGEQLEKLIAHLKKYQIPYNLDAECSSLIADLESARGEFYSILKAGLMAKKKLPKNNEDSLLASLSPTFKRRLTQHQLHAVYHLTAIRNGANFSVPGSGKTSILLAYYHLLRSVGAVEAILVIGPASCFEPWEREYKLCFGRSPSSIRVAGNTRGKRREIYSQHKDYELILSTYHTAARDVQDIIRVLSRRKYLVVLDESHNIKRPQGGKLAEAVIRFSEFSERRVILTGTPMPNGLADLWSQFTFLWKNMLPLGTVDNFLRDIEKKDPKEALKSVRHSVLPLFFRITKSQLGLPRPRFIIVKCELSKLQGRIYRGIAAKFLSQAEERPEDRDSLREWRRARAIRLLQVAVNPGLLCCARNEFSLSAMNLTNLPMGSAIEHYADYEIPDKILKCTQIAKNLVKKGKKIIIWSSFVHNLLMLEELLKDLIPVVVYGEIPYSATDADELTREKLIAKFKTDPDCRVLIANPAACAESISLHMACHDAIYLDRSFNCAHYLQSLDRIHRLGLKPNDIVTYYLLKSLDTIDEIVHDRLEEKARNMREVTEGALPGEIAGFWSDDLGGEEDTDLDLVENHIKLVASKP